MDSLGETFETRREIEQLRSQLDRYRNAALTLYGPLKVSIQAMPDDAVGKLVWMARLNVFRHAFDIRY